MYEEPDKFATGAWPMSVPDIPFPASIPKAYPIIEGEPTFDPAVHLALEKPTRCVCLGDFGYDEKTSNAAPTQVAVAGPMRIFSDDGVAAMRESARAFRRLNARTEGDPKAAYVKPRGSAYSSKFMRDICACPDITTFFSEIVGVDLIGHPMPTVRSTLVFEPQDISKTQQGWHLDTVGFACVIALHDPATLDGGRFQYFNGTRSDVARLCQCPEEQLIRSVGKLTDLPAERVESLAFPGPGYGVLMQGNYVLHRGEPMGSPGERMMFVPGLVVADPSVPDVTHWSEIQRFNSPALVAEYARYKAWRAQTKLDAFIRGASMESDPAELRTALADAMEELTPFVNELDS